VGIDPSRPAQAGDLALSFRCQNEKDLCMIHFYRPFEDEDLRETYEH